MNTKDIKTNDEVTIDAAGRSFGRVATEAAETLRGKNSPDFVKNRIMGKKVVIENASSVRITTRNKTVNKVYVKYSGYPGGKKEETLKKLIERRGAGEAFRRAVYGMLPNNKLRPKLMNRLKIFE